MKTGKNLKNLVPQVTIDPSLSRYKGAFPEKLARANEVLRHAQFPDAVKKQLKANAGNRQS